MSQVHVITPMGSDGIVRCYTHGLRASLNTSNSDKNPGRQYYCCAKSLSDPDRCNFWRWADDSSVKKRQPPNTTNSPLYPQPSSQAQDFPVSTPRKRSFSACQTTPELTPSQKRTKLMREALQGITTPSQSQPTVIEPVSTSTRGSQKRLEDIRRVLSPKAPSQGSQKRLDDIWRALPTSQNSNHDTNQSRDIEEISATRTLQQSPSTSYSQASVNSSPGRQVKRTSDSEGSDEALRARVTAPSNPLGPLSKEHSVTLTNNDEGATLSGTHSHWRSLDPDNPFNDSIPQSQILNSTSTYVSASESFVDLSADTIASLLHGLDSIPDHVRKVERKLLAAEKSNSAKAKRISALEEEVERLQREKKALHDALILSNSGRVV